MDQRGESNRDVVQVGRDHTHKSYESNWFTKKLTQINLPNYNDLFNQKDSELNEYLSRWDKFTQDHKAQIVIYYIRETQEANSKISKVKESITTVISLILITVLFLFAQISDNQSFIELAQFNSYKFSLSILCIGARPQYHQIFPFCYTLDKAKSSPIFYSLVKEDYDNFNIFSSQFEIATYGLIVFSVYILIILMCILLIAKSFLVIANFLAIPIESLINLQNRQNRKAGIKNSQLLFNLLTEYEKSLVRDEVSNKELKYVSATAANKKYHEIYILNKTGAAIIVAIRYENLNNDWVITKWILVEPSRRKLVAKTRDIKFYYYAESTDPLNKSSYWGGNDYLSTINGSEKQYNFGERKINNQNWDSYTQTLV